MNEEQYWYNRGSQDVLYSDRQHEATMNILHTKNEMALFESMKPSLTKDGDMWCVLYGENLQEGVSGFGKTPFAAIVEFNKNFLKP